MYIYKFTYIYNTGSVIFLENGNNIWIYIYIHNDLQECELDCTAETQRRSWHIETPMYIAGCLEFRRNLPTVILRSYSIALQITLLTDCFSDNRQRQTWTSFRENDLLILSVIVLLSDFVWDRERLRIVCNAAKDSKSFVMNTNLPIEPFLLSIVRLRTKH